MKQILLVSILLALLLAWACTPIPPGQEGEKPDLTEAEEDFDPLAQDADRPILIRAGEDTLGEISSPGQAVQEPVYPDDLTSPQRPGIVQGYRVQIFLSNDLREASRVMSEARLRFDGEVYLEYDAPYYKIRVGDCRTEGEGEELLNVASRLGYPDAWLVRSVISVAGDDQLGAEPE